MKIPVLFFAALAALPASAQVNVLSFNIRYDNPADGPNAWPYRAGQVAELVKKYEADIVGMQEVLDHQLKDLLERLPEYSWVGHGRDDGYTRGEYSPILFRADRYAIQVWNQRWLSETPEQPGSKSWDACCPRIVTWVKLKDLRTGLDFLVVNTHWDHQSRKARRESARLLRAWIEEWREDMPVIFMGDLNALPDAPEVQGISAFLQDARLASEETPLGPVGTFQGFEFPAGDAVKRIDYIFVSPEWRVEEYRCIDDSREGRYPSDHFPVLASVSLR